MRGKKTDKSENLKKEKSQGGKKSTKTRCFKTGLVYTKNYQIQSNPLVDAFPLCVCVKKKFMLQNSFFIFFFFSLLVIFFFLLFFPFVFYFFFWFVFLFRFLFLFFFFFVVCLFQKLPAIYFIASSIRPRKKNVDRCCKQTS